MIRKAKKDDMREISELDKEAGKEINWWTNLHKSDLLGGNLFYVIENDKKIIGFLRACKKKDYVELEDLFLKREFRKKGFAQQLTTFFINDIKKSKYQKIKLICPERLMGFNQELGFKVTSLNMEKRLK
jgi:N-acetylglutamate synthase-like GNAT family acetyltransferase